MKERNESEKRSKQGRKTGGKKIQGQGAALRKKIRGK